MEMKNLGLVILVLALLVGLGIAVEYNYQPSKGAEDRNAERPYKGYSDAELAALIAAYEQEAEALDSRYDAAKSRSVETRSGSLLDERIAAFERAQKVGDSTRSLGAVVAQKEAVLRELRREESLRATSGDGLLQHLRRLLRM
jgi:hypothetical protein